MPFAGDEFSQSHTLPARYQRGDSAISDDSAPENARARSAAEARSILKELTKDAGVDDEDDEVAKSKANLRRSTRHLKERIALQ